MHGDRIQEARQKSKVKNQKAKREEGEGVTFAFCDLPCLFEQSLDNLRRQLFQTRKDKTRLSKVIMECVFIGYSDAAYSCVHSCHDTFVGILDHHAALWW